LLKCSKSRLIRIRPEDARDDYGPCMQALMARMFAWLEAGQLNPRISHIFALENFQEAMAVVLRRLSLGRVAVVMDEEAKRLGK